MNHTSLFFKTFSSDNLASPSLLGLLHSCVWITRRPAHTLYFFMNSSTVVKSLCTCLKAALYCTSSLEQVAVYLFTQVKHQWTNIYLDQVAVYLFTQVEHQWTNIYLDQVTVYLVMQVKHQWTNIYLEQVVLYCSHRWNISEQTFTWSRWLCTCSHRWNINKQFTGSRQLLTYSHSSDTGKTSLNNSLLGAAGTQNLLPLPWYIFILSSFFHSFSNWWNVIAVQIYIHAKHLKCCVWQ